MDNYYNADVPKFALESIKDTDPKSIKIFTKKKRLTITTPKLLQRCETAQPINFYPAA